ncbi:MAG: hypothetical protein AAGF27_06490 [Pseudomonadota bacterium]
MSLPLASQPIPSDLSDRTMTLSLNILETGIISLRSCEVIGKSFRNRVSFQDQKAIETVLVARFASAIRTCLEGLPEGAHVLSIPEFLVELPGLALSGIHVMVMDARDGVRSAILRIKEFIGATSAVFKTDIGFYESFATHSEKLAVNVLEDICLPILNMCRGFYTREGALDCGTAQRLMNRAQEFEFQTELLKRFIYNAGMGHAEATDRYLYEQCRPSAKSIAE